MRCHMRSRSRRDQNSIGPKIMNMKLVIERPYNKYMAVQFLLGKI